MDKNLFDKLIELIRSYGPESVEVLSFRESNFSEETAELVDDIIQRSMINQKISRNNITIQRNFKYPKPNVFPRIK